MNSFLWIHLLESTSLKKVSKNTMEDSCHQNKKIHLIIQILCFTHWYVDVILSELRLDHICHVEAVGQAAVAVVGVVGGARGKDVGEVVALRELANLYLEKSR